HVVANIMDIVAIVLALEDQGRIPIAPRLDDDLAGARKFDARGFLPATVREDVDLLGRHAPLEQLLLEGHLQPGFVDTSPRRHDDPGQGDQGEKSDPHGHQPEGEDLHVSERKEGGAFDQHRLSPRRLELEVAADHRTASGLDRYSDDAQIYWGLDPSLTLRARDPLPRGPRNEPRQCTPQRYIVRSSPYETNLRQRSLSRLSRTPPAGPRCRNGVPGRPGRGAGRSARMA